MDIDFGQHLDLLDLHGRAAVASLGQLGPSHTLPPRGVLAHRAAREHWATLEVWAWSLEHPGEHWSERVEPTPPGDHAGVVAAIGVEITRLEELLLAAGEHTPIDYFGRRGCTGDVARLLAHEAITTAHAASLAAGRTSPALSTAVAADGIGQALDHWAEPDAPIGWQARPALLRTTDSDHAWPVDFGQDRRGDLGSIRAGSVLALGTDGASVVVEAPSATLLWWLHGHHVDEDVTVTGDPDLVRTLARALGHELEPTPGRRTWWRR